jgi:hypothetical protein
MDQLLVLTRGIPFAASLGPPFGGFFQSKDCTILLACKRHAGTRPVAVWQFGEQPELGATKYRLVANRELSHVDIRSSL